MRQYARLCRIATRSRLRFKRLLGSKSAAETLEFQRLRQYGHSACTTSLLGPAIKLSHASSFEPMYREIFERNLYAFPTTATHPRVIDCGANIGLASIFVARLYPNAQITAFEADPQLAEIAKFNLAAFRLHQVKVVAAAVTAKQGSVPFFSTGDLAGRVGRPHDHNLSSVHTVTSVDLRDYLDEPIDFLKIDIEGTEYDVLSSVRDKLHNVTHLFVEYHGFAQEPQSLPDLLALLSNVGFRYYITNAYDFRRSPLCENTCNLGMDLQLNIFCNRIAGRLTS